MFRRLDFLKRRKVFVETKLCLSLCVRFVSVCYFWVLPRYGRDLDTQARIRMGGTEIDIFSGLGLLSSPLPNIVLASALPLTTFRFRLGSRLLAIENFFRKLFIKII